jgi:serine phosphatase RsbU (regulator of sigma subunit)
MHSPLKSSLLARLVFLAGGLTVLVFVSFLLWAGFTAPLNLRWPVPSADGKYFAYFDTGEGGNPGDGAGYGLIVSTPRGRLMARFRLAVGSIQWSNADHLTVVDRERTGAVLIANAEARFVFLTQIVLSQGAEPRWSRDGNKLACVRPGPAGDQLAIHDVQQPQALVIPLPPEFHLRHPKVLFWSPGSDYLFLLNEEGQDAVLSRIDVLAGTVVPLARGLSGGEVAGPRPPQISPDGTRIFLARPPNRVIDAQTGETSWGLPADAEALWVPWSADGRYLFYYRQQAPADILAHDFSGGSDQVVVSGAQPSGFFTADGRSYFFRARPNLPLEGPGSSWRGWREKLWGWQQVDRATQSSRPLGRLELGPRYQTLDGSILAHRDDYTSVRFGLYDPDAGVLEEYVFPTAREDLIRQIQSHRLILLAVAVYALLAFMVYWKHPASPPARAFYILAFLGLALFAAQSLSSSAVSARLACPSCVAGGGIPGLDTGWTSSLPELVLGEAAFVAALLWALLPLVLLHFALVFPEGNRLLARWVVLKPALYGVGLLPPVAVLLSRQAAGFSKGLVRGWLILAAGAATLAWVLTLIRGYRHPPDRRTRDQAVWMTMALGLAAAGVLLLLLARGLAGFLTGPGSQRILKVLSAAALVLPCGLAPPAIAYALVARKHYNLRLLLRRLVRHVSMAFPVLMVFLLLWGGVGWVMTGSFVTLSLPVIAVAVLLTVLLTMPFRGRLRNFVDRTFDRAGFDFREKLFDFAQDLPHLLDRRTLVAQLGDTLTKAMGARRLYLFVLDRHAQKLRLLPGKGGVPSGTWGVEFEPAEPLCKYLLETDRPFEVEVSPYRSELIPIFRAAAEGFAKLEAALILGLKRRHELLGLLILGPKLSGEFYDAEDLELLAVIARETAVALENIDLFEEVARDRELRRELEDASEVQIQLFPRVVPRLASGRLAGRCVLARSACGDYYDFLELPEHKVALAIGDVCGQGMSASLLMANVQGLLRTQAVTAESLGELARKINRHLHGSLGGTKFCTLFYGVYDDVRRQFEYINAGHNPPLVITPQGVRYFEATGLPLGLFPEVAHSPRFEELEPGTLLVLYSDGITEARNVRGETYGLNRLMGAISRARDAEVERLLAKILADVNEFTEGAPIEDDRTLVLLKLNAAAASRG